MRALRLAVGIGLFLLSGDAFSQPKLCGNQAALGNWNLDSCPQLRDDGVGADESAGDGIYSIELALDPTSLLEYKLLPLGTWATALGQLGTCDHNGNATGNDTGNVRIVKPDVGRPVRFYLDTRSLADPSYASPPGNRSFGDTLMLRSPAGECPRWFVVGDFQNLVGVNGTAVELQVLRPGVLVGKHVSSKSLGIGWKWKVMEQSAVGARELGPSGYAYAPCTTPSVAASSSVNPGDNVYFVVDMRTGRLRTVVSATPLDGFGSDGTPLCPPVVDMASPSLDFATVSDGGATSVVDLQSGAASDGGSDKPLPGIHCDCQLAGTAGAPPPSPAWVGLALLTVLRRWSRGRRLRR